MDKKKASTTYEYDPKSFKQAITCAAIVWQVPLIIKHMLYIALWDLGCIFLLIQTDFI